ncbi:hypothetical protein TSUD_119960 [Trifolium subterraneum]|uniref:Uncharacterized protein n=1 Tax=Trifolium subterraneum TaxID=3900 RepID=A0A2Z6NQH4_TRISU|nr:hypothetical protein TSUD_119960 [Trifolium subterraneum]
MEFFNVAFKSWHNMPSMKYGRSLPVLGVTEDRIIPYKYSSSITSRKTQTDPSTFSSKNFDRSFLLISVGGIGSYDISDRSPLNCGETYDSLSNEWTEISRLPLIGVYGNLFDYFTVCEVSESNTNVYRKQISWICVDPKWGAYPSWTRPIAVEGGIAEASVYSGEIVYRRQRIAEVPAVTGKNIQHSESCSRSRSSTVNACSSRKEEDEEEEETFGGTDDDKLMYSGEMYDSLTNKWTKIQRLPSDFESPYSGIVCGKMFYVISEIHKLAAYDIEKGFWFAIQTSSFPPHPPIIEPKLVSPNGRLYMVSNCLPKIQQGIQSQVTTIWELDLMHLTWTEISTNPYVNIGWSSANFVANRNLIFGIHMFESPSGCEISHYFNICDVSESNMAKWSNISTNLVAHSGSIIVSYIQIQYPTRQTCSSTQQLCNRRTRSRHEYD